MAGEDGWTVVVAKAGSDRDGRANTVVSEMMLLAGEVH